MDKEYVRKCCSIFFGLKTLVSVLKTRDWLKFELDRFCFLLNLVEIFLILIVFRNWGKLEWIFRSLNFLSLPVSDPLLKFIVFSNRIPVWSVNILNLSVKNFKLRVFLDIYHFVLDVKSDHFWRLWFRSHFDRLLLIGNKRRGFNRYTLFNSTVIRLRWLILIILLSFIIYLLQFDVIEITFLQTALISEDVIVNVSQDVVIARHFSLVLIFLLSQNLIQLMLLVDWVRRCLTFFN